MQGNYTRIYAFRNSSDGNIDPYRKLKIIVGIIIGLYILDVWLMGTEAMIGALTEYLFRIPIILISLTVHEFAHAGMADFLGDSTARRLGRLSLNPMRHLELFGTILLLFGNFGWAKPVPVDSSNFRKPERAMVSVSLAGPMANVLLGFLGGAITWIGANYDVTLLGKFGVILVLINLSLAIFNLIPIPPLDGSKVLYFFLTPRGRFQYRAFEYMGPLLLILLVSIGIVGMIISPLVVKCSQAIFSLYGLRFY
ncbi:site-2 protease family protein [bacterium]|nr:site-2 protease family protein [bacterium]